MSELARDGEVLAQHHAAVKVGGRRLSTTIRPRPHFVAPEPETAGSRAVDEPVDYPRPAAPGEHTEHDHGHHNEEEGPKKDKKHVSHEFAHKKVEDTKPTREFQPNGKSFGGGGRIAQPAGKEFKVM